MKFSIKGVLITIIIFIFLGNVLISGIGGILTYQYLFTNGTLREPILEQIITSIQVPPPPSADISLYKGFWMPVVFYSENLQSMADTDELKLAGANIVSLGPTIRINSNGNIKYPGAYQSIEVLDIRLAELAKKYYSAGIRIHLVIELYYEEEFTRQGSGEPQPIPKDIAEKEGFLDEYNILVEKMAIIADKYQVEMFSPMNEPDRKLGTKIAAEWSQKILPVIKEHYKGKIVFKGNLHEDEGDYINFKGYDVIGFIPSLPTENMSKYRIMLADIIQDARRWAERDGIPEIMVAEFGAWMGMGISEEESILRHRILFEEGRGKVDGFIIFDPIEGEYRPLKGSETLEEIKVWFKEKLNN